MTEKKDKKTVKYVVMRKYLSGSKIDRPVIDFTDEEEAKKFLKKLTSKVKKKEMYFIQESD